MFRARSRDIIPDLVKIIRKALKKNVSLALWFCEIFSNQEIIKEFLLDCPVTDMQRFTSGLLQTAMQTLYKYEEEAIARYMANLDKVSAIGLIQETQGAKIIKICEDNTKTGVRVELTDSTPGNYGAAAGTKPIAQDQREDYVEP